MGGVNIIFGVLINTVISIYHIKYQNISFTLLAGIAGVLFSLGISYMIAIKMASIGKLLKIYGQHTLLILCTHYFVLRLIGDISNRLIGVNLWRYTSTPKSIFLTCIIMATYFYIIKDRKIN